jgi:hypothetical protein
MVKNGREGKLQALGGNVSMIFGKQGYRFPRKF